MIAWTLNRYAERCGKMTHVWYWKKKLPERKGQPCRVLARGKKNSVLVEFADGFKVITSRFAVRKEKQK